MRGVLVQFLRKARDFWFTPLLEGQRRYSKYQSLRALAFNHAVQDTFNEFQEDIEMAMIFEKLEIRSFCCDQIQAPGEENTNHLFLEFGVYGGKSLNFFAKQCPNHRFVGFDSFKGLSDDWAGTSSRRGAFDRRGVVPKTRENVTLVAGEISETLPPFLEENKGRKIFFMHIDTDTYSAASIILSHTKPLLIEGSIILFDELHSYPGWRRGEYLALREELPRESYEFIAFSQKRAAIRIVRPDVIINSRTNAQ